MVRDFLVSKRLLWKILLDQCIHGRNLDAWAGFPRVVVVGTQQSTAFGPTIPTFPFPARQGRVRRSINRNDRIPAATMVAATLSRICAMRGAEVLWFFERGFLGN
jgi:hypothetical protein